MKIETKCQGSEFEKFDSVMKALLTVPKHEIAKKAKRARRQTKENLTIAALHTKTVR